MNFIEWSDFEKIDLRVGTIIKVENFPQAKKAAYKLWVDLGPLGVKASSAQITTCYDIDSLLEKQVLCVVNFPPKQVANFISEILVTGFVLEEGKVILASTDQRIPNGTRLA
ncbi:MAG: tRNA-binding protein [Bdellovibrionales bacterium]|nr:tRNA-binding protein [Bdellovibrionales bacterium]